MPAGVRVVEPASRPREAPALPLQKNAAGMIFGLRNNNTAAQKHLEEEKFRAWVATAGDGS